MKSNENLVGCSIFRRLNSIKLFQQLNCLKMYSSIAVLSTSAPIVTNKVSDLRLYLYDWWLYSMLSADRNLFYPRNKMSTFYSSNWLCSCCFCQENILTNDSIKFCCNEILTRQVFIYSKIIVLKILLHLSL